MQDSKRSQLVGENDIVPVLPLPKTTRLNSLYEHFIAKYKEEPDFYVRVPGRVNIIGEHIDYCSYAVCPMAIQQDILLAVKCKPTDTMLRLTNVEQDYEDYACDISSFRDAVIADVGRSSAGPEWYSYFLCGVRGVAEAPGAPQTLAGMRVAVFGNIPHSSGLSSSSALVSAAAVATARTNKMAMSKQQLANLCAECERHIGTQGGGMDQAIAFLATEGCAKLISFHPLRSRDVMLPNDAVFVVSHSLARLNKAATADYNQRVVECRLAAQIIAKKSGISNWSHLKKLSDVQAILGGLSLKDMYAFAEKFVPSGILTRSQVCEILDIQDSDLANISLTPNTTHLTEFKVKSRVIHVLQEASRVEEFVAICDKAGESGDINNDDVLRQLGSLMIASHESLRDLYECSHEKLDKLVAVSKDVALGCRLTGAGWGGCAVALVQPANVDNYIKTLEDKFYQELGVEDNFDNLIFVTTPNSGACIYKP